MLPDSSKKLIARLTQSVLIEVEGRDSERYLNNRLSNDIKRLQAGGPAIYAAALSVQGKTEGLFLVFRKSVDSYLLIADGGDSSEILASLSRYKVADKVNFKLVSDQFQAIHIFGSEDTEHKPSDFLDSIAQTYKNEIVFAHKRKRFEREGIDLILRKESKLTELENFSEITEEQQRLWRIKARIPCFPEEIGPQFLLQESGLEGCYSTSKGCYVGQEVIQKIASFANTPGRLFAFNVEEEIAEGLEPLSKAQNEAEKLGVIISCAHENKHTFGFVRIKSKFAGSPEGYLDGKIINFSAIYDYTK